MNGSVETKKISGLITSVSISGTGDHSAAMGFTVLPMDGTDMPFRVPNNEAETVNPQLFYAKSAIITAAYFGKTPVTVDWAVDEDVPVAATIKVPATT